jgi:hypothetical protein
MTGFTFGAAGKSQVHALRLHAKSVATETLVRQYEGGHPHGSEAARTGAALWASARARQGAASAFFDSRHHSLRRVRAPASGPGMHSSLALFARVHEFGTRAVEKLLRSKYHLDAHQLAAAAEQALHCAEAEVAMDRAAAGGATGGGGVAHAQDEGDMAHYTPDALLARRRVLAHPRVAELLDQWWLVAKLVDHDGDEVLSKEEYRVVYERLIASFAEGGDGGGGGGGVGGGGEGGVEGFDEADAMAAFDEDWDNDNGDDEVVDKEEFKASIFELADQWTETTEPAEYIEFLETLFVKVHAHVHDYALEAGHIVRVGGGLGGAGGGGCELHRGSEAFLAACEADAAYVPGSRLTSAFSLFYLLTTNSLLASLSLL